MVKLGRGESRRHCGSGDILILVVEDFARFLNSNITIFSKTRVISCSYILNFMIKSSHREKICKCVQ